MPYSQNARPLAYDRLKGAISSPLVELSDANLPPIDRGSTRISQNCVDLPEIQSTIEQHTAQATMTQNVTQNVNLAHAEQLTFGQKIADKIASTMGSWCFIAAQTAMIAAWIVVNMIPGMPHWDSNPFILLNLVMAFQAAYAAPIIMMSQNRQSAKDHLAADIDHEINLRNAAQLEQILNRLDAIEQKTGPKLGSKSS